MSQGNWLNNDGLYIQYGTTKAIPEIGGDYKSYGESREIEWYICGGQYAWGTGNPTIPAIPAGFTSAPTSWNTTTPLGNGVQSYTTLMPMQTTAASSVSSTNTPVNGITTFTGSQLFIEQMDLEILQTFNSGSGGATTIQVGFCVQNPSNNTFSVCTPSGLGLGGLIAAAAVSTLTVGSRWTFFSDGSSIGTSTAPTAGVLFTTNSGVVPSITNSFTGGNLGSATFVPQFAYLMVTGITNGFKPASGCTGLAKLRLRYNMFGNINQ